MPADEVEDAIDICLDGVVYVTPLEGEAARENWIKADITHVWRKHDEHHLAAPAGYDKCAKQAPVERIVPLWGGVGVGGFADMLWHDRRKTDGPE